MEVFMTNNMPTTNTSNPLGNKASKTCTSELKNSVINLNALSRCFALEENHDVLDARQESQAWLEALGAQGGLQEMLAAQMLSIHHLQQISIAMANKTVMQPNHRQYFSNTAIKLANTFVQQATLLAKLQGAGSQKIVVEHVEVHHGGQAVVGNVTANAPINEAKN
jgi:hypothetical protein